MKTFRQFIFGGNKPKVDWHGSFKQLGEIAASNIANELRTKTSKNLNVKVDINHFEGDKNNPEQFHVNTTGVSRNLRLSPPQEILSPEILSPPAFINWAMKHIKQQNNRVKGLGPPPKPTSSDTLRSITFHGNGVITIHNHGTK